MKVGSSRAGWPSRWRPTSTAPPSRRSRSRRGSGRGPDPRLAYGSLLTILFAEAAASFEELTLGHRTDQLKMQVADAWPNLFRQARFLSAVDLVQADWLRRKVAEEMARLFSTVDVLLVPSLRNEMLTITNFTGRPSLTLRTGFIEVNQARSD
jgi:Asp-tRNA(Asn)/Glu-tRNA(Gln) amidotransferase A subunit family amidase